MWRLKDCITRTIDSLDAIATGSEADDIVVDRTFDTLGRSQSGYFGNDVDLGVRMRPKGECPGGRTSHNHRFDSKCGTRLGDSVTARSRQLGCKWDQAAASRCFPLVLTPFTNFTPENTSFSSSGAFSRRNFCSATINNLKIIAEAFSTFR